MCGIGGVFRSRSEKTLDIVSKFERLLRKSESRGRDASGVVFITDSEISYLKVPSCVKELFKLAEYQQQVDVLSRSDVRYSGLVGHTRLATNGDIDDNLNNQPIVRNGICCIHNGIITNSRDIFEEIGEVPRTQLDSEIIPVYFRQGLKKNQSLADITKSFFEKIEGTASFACLFEDFHVLLLATNNGSIYFTDDDGEFCFASQKNIIADLCPDFALKRIEKEDGAYILNLKKMAAFSSENSDLTRHEVPIVEIPVSSSPKHSFCIKHNTLEVATTGLLEKHYDECRKEFAEMARCVSCILPQTFPFIEFNSEGVCNYCLNYQQQSLRGESEFIELIKRGARDSRNPKVLVGLSGGRDSCYALHLVKKHFDEVYAFSYDWGVITDLARRNQARMCEKLNVEHIFVAADLGAKRQNIKLNVEAWLNRPNLGSVPLFMAGDKHYFYYANRIKEEYEIDSVVFGENLLETTFFKYGFCGIPPNFGRRKSFHLGMDSKFKMLSFYLKEFFVNPKYLNRSLLDSFKGFVSFYFIPHNYINVYNYTPWVEDEVNSTLISQYNWEIDPEYSSTWRIGDGTAALYNFIYFSYVGFSELETFRSNQIRSGFLTRDRALELVEVESAPRIQAIKWYCDHMDLDMNYVVRRIVEDSKQFRLTSLG